MFDKVVPGLREAAAFRAEAAASSAGNVTSHERGDLLGCLPVNTRPARPLTSLNVTLGVIYSPLASRRAKERQHNKQGEAVFHFYGSKRKKKIRPFVMSRMPLLPLSGSRHCPPPTSESVSCEIVARKTCCFWRSCEFPAFAQ